MQTFEIPLYKRKGKFIFYTIAMAFNALVLIMVSLAALNKTVWWQILMGTLFLIGFIVTVKGLNEYLLYGNVKLVVESMSGKIKFYCLSSTGRRFINSKEFELEKIAQIYPVRRTSRFLYKNYSYEIVGNTKLTKLFREPVEVFPALFEANEKDRSAVLYFIKSLKPEIEIGYKNIVQRAVGD